MLLALPALLSLAQSSSWRDLFDGRGLDGWEEHGGTAEFGVEDGAIVGTTVVGSANSFLCTQRVFGDFKLELEFRVDPALNSGVQVRSEVFTDARKLVVDGKEIALERDRVHGY